MEEVAGSNPARSTTTWRTFSVRANLGQPRTLAVMIGVIDYRAGNAPSVGYALERLGIAHRLVNDAAGVDDCDRIILPASEPRARRSSRSTPPASIAPLAATRP